MCANVFQKSTGAAVGTKYTSKVLVDTFGAKLGAFIIRNNSFQLLTSTAHEHGCIGLDPTSKSMQEVETAALAGAYMMNFNQGWKTDRSDCIKMQEALKYGFDNFHPYNFGTILSGIYSVPNEESKTQGMLDEYKAKDVDFLSLMKGPMDEKKPKFQVFLKENNQLDQTCFSDFIQKFDTKLNT